MLVCNSAHNGYGWAFNQRLVIDALQRNKTKANYFVTVEAMDGKATELVRKSAKVDSFVALLRKLKDACPDDKVLIVIDNSAVITVGK